MNIFNDFELLTMKDKKDIDLRWANRIPKGTGPEVDHETMSDK